MRRVTRAPVQGEAARSVRSCGPGMWGSETGEQGNSLTKELVRYAQVEILMVITQQHSHLPHNVANGFGCLGRTRW